MLRLYFHHLVLIPLLFVIAVECSTHALVYCEDPGWILSHGYCYMFANVPKTHLAAESMCESMGGHLTSIHSIQEDEFIIHVIERTGRITSTWIGLTDRVVEGTFVWLDGTPKNFTKWGSSEPNNAARATLDNPNGEEDCVSIEAGGTWNDADCDHEKNYMCKKADTFQPRITFCPSDIVQQIKPGTLNTEVSWVPPAVRNISGEVTVEASNIPGDLFPVGKTLVYYTFTDHAVNNSDYCVFTVNVIEVYCPSPWQMFDGFCYYVSDTIESFADANIACYSAGASLTSIHDLNENDFIAEQMVDRDVINMWIGLQFVYVGYSGKFEWTDGTALTYNNWRAGEPNNGGQYFSSNLERAAMETKEDCGTMALRYRTTADYNGWNDEQCTLQRNYMCKKENNNDFASCPRSITTDVELGLTTGTSVVWIEPTVYYESVTNLERSHTPGTEFSIGVTSVNYTFTDMENNTIMCDFTVTVREVDTIAPEIRSCPGDIFQKVEKGSGPVLPMYWTPPIVFDLSEDVSVTQSHTPGDTFSVIWTTRVQYDFSDPSGNTATCSFAIIMVEDTYIASDGRCPESNWIIYDGFCYHLSLCKNAYSDAQAMCESMYASLTSVHSVKENLFLEDMVQQLNSIKLKGEKRVWIGLHDIAWEGLFTWMDGTNETYTNFADGEPSDHWTGNEDCIEMKESGQWNDVACDNNNYYICKKAENIPVQCPHSFETIAEPGVTEKAVFWDEPANITYESWDIHVKGSHFPGDMFPIGVTWVSYTLQDSNNLNRTCRFSITVLAFDTTPPIIEACPSNIIQKTEQGTQKVPVSWETPSASDASGKVLMNQTRASGDIFPLGLHDVTYTFTDDSGNTASCAFQVSVVEVDTRPIHLINCPPRMITSTKVDSRSAKLAWTEPNTKDPFDNVTLLAKTHSPGDIFPVGATDVSYFFVDSSFNLAVCNFTLHVNADDVLVTSDSEESTGSPSSSVIGFTVALVFLLVILIILIIIAIYCFRKTGKNSDLEYLNMGVESK